MKLILTDLDGTLVDTFKANYLSYKEVLLQYDIELAEEQYRLYFGFKLVDLLSKISKKQLPIDEIKNTKALVYKNHFDKLILNKSLLDIILLYKRSGIPVGIVSTASLTNILSILEYFDINNLFDIIISGEDVKHGKPSPECYEKAYKSFNVNPSDVLVFEDSEIGVESAITAKLNVIQINKFYNEI